MAAAKKPQSKYHVAKVREAALVRIEDARKEALADAPKFINSKFDTKRLKELEDVSDEVAALLVAGKVCSEGEIAAAREMAAAALAKSAAAQ